MMNTNLTELEILKIKCSLEWNIKYHKEKIKTAQRLLDNKNCTEKQKLLLKRSIEAHNCEIDTLESIIAKLG